MKTNKKININEDALRTLCLAWEDGGLTDAEERLLVAILAEYDGSDETILSTIGAISYILKSGVESERRIKRIAVRKRLWRDVAAVMIPAVVLVTLLVGGGREREERYLAVHKGETTTNRKVAVDIMNNQLDLLAAGAEEYSPTESEEFIFEN